MLLFLICVRISPPQKYKTINSFRGGGERASEKNSEIRVVVGLGRVCGADDRKEQARQKRWTAEDNVCASERVESRDNKTHAMPIINLHQRKL